MWVGIWMIFTMGMGHVKSYGSLLLGLNYSGFVYVFGFSAHFRQSSCVKVVFAVFGCYPPITQQEEGHDALKKRGDIINPNIAMRSYTT